MRPAGDQSRPHQIAGFESRHRRHGGTRLPTPGEYRHALAVAGMTAEGRIDHECGPDVAPDQDGVAPFDLAAAERPREHPMGRVGLRHDQQPRGILVESMHESRTSLRTVREWRAPRHQRVEQRIVPVPGGRMDHQARRFVQHEQRFVLVHDRKGTGIRRELTRRIRIRKTDFHAVAVIETSRGSRYRSIDLHGADRDQPPGNGPGKRKLVGEESVKTLGDVNANAEDRVCSWNVFTPPRRQAAPPLLPRRGPLALPARERVPRPRLRRTRPCRQH